MSWPARRWAPTWTRALALANTYAWQTGRKYRVRCATTGFMIYRMSRRTDTPTRRYGRLVGVEPRPMKIGWMS